MNDDPADARALARQRKPINRIMNLSNNAKSQQGRNAAENGAPRGGKARILAAFLLGYAVNSLFGVWNVRFPLQQEKGGKKTTTTTNIDKIVNGLQPSGDLFTLTHYDKDEQELMEEIRKEQESGKRDKYYLPQNYRARLDNKHFDDTSVMFANDEWQKEVYIAAMLLARRLVPSNNDNGTGRGKHQERNRTGLVLDIGAGSGYKLMKFLSPEFETIGFETEPAISFLRKKYPNEEWVDSGKPEESLPESWNSNSRKPDVCICSDVIEHIRDPNDLARFLLSLQCKAYVISTPKREGFKSFMGPPGNKHHVREWTLHEFKMFLESLGFRVVKSYEGIQHITTQFAIAVPDNNKKKE